MPEYLTKRGLALLKKELEELKNIKRREIAERLRETASFGDLSENAEYVEAKEAQAVVENRIEEVEDILRNAQVVDGRGSRSSVQVGRAVEIDSGSRRHSFTLVGREEADPINRKISPESPMGKALLGKKIGDILEVQTPNGIKRYKIVKIA